MKIYLDTAIIEEIKEANDMGVICGVTTNPSLIAKPPRPPKSFRRSLKSSRSHLREVKRPRRC